MNRRRWHGATKKRILEPALQGLPAEFRALVKQDLERLLVDPESPGFFWTEWKGTPDTNYPWRSRVALIAGGRVAIRYVVLKDQPLIMVLALVVIRP